MSKVVKANGASATKLENKIAKTISEITVPEVAEEVKNLAIVSAKELTLKGKKAIVVFVPFRQHKRFLKIQKKLITEVEKKFPGTHVLLIAQRTVLSANMARWTNTKLPHSRTLAAVQDAILTDVVSPSKIVGKRIRFKTDGSQVLKVFVDKKDAKEVEEKLSTFTQVYQRLTSRAVEFKFQ